MKVTKELIQNDITALESQLEMAKASVNKIAGALSALQGMVDYMDKVDAVPIQELAEAVAGPGAVVEEITSLESQDGIVTVDQVGSNFIVDGGGKYRKATIEA